jgi:hypothetical protein
VILNNLVFSSPTQIVLAKNIALVYESEQAKKIAEANSFFFLILNGNMVLIICQGGGGSLRDGGRDQEGDPDLQYDDGRFVSSEGMVIGEGDYPRCDGGYGAVLEAGV